MADKKTSGVKKDISLTEFSTKMNQVAPKEGDFRKKLKSFFSNVGDILTSLGLFPVLRTTSKVRRHGSIGGAYHSSESNIRETYRVEPPPQRTHEDMVVEHMAHDAYMQMVDGKGDPKDCNCDHDR